jgi:hypothetical protein
MRKLRVSILLTLVALFMLAGMMKPTQEVKAVSYERIFTVYWDCNLCPISIHCGGVEGEWTMNCDGTLTGWGWRPGDICSSTRMRRGAECIE